MFTDNPFFLAGSLAQLVEQRTLNPLVAGSIPSRPTMFTDNPFFLAGSLAQLVEQRTLNPLVAGSIPSRPTTWTLSSVWLEHLPYKQRVDGSSPLASTTSLTQVSKHVFYGRLAQFG